MSIYPSRREYFTILRDPCMLDIDRLVAGWRCLEDTEDGASLVDEDGEHWSHDDIHTYITDHGLWGADKPPKEDDDDHDD